MKKKCSDQACWRACEADAEAPLTHTKRSYNPIARKTDRDKLYDLVPGLDPWGSSGRTTPGIGRVIPDDASKNQGYVWQR
jgi:hypothetical protein